MRIGQEIERKLKGKPAYRSAHKKKKPIYGDDIMHKPGCFIIPRFAFFSNAQA
jgi:hypothetical protein